MEITVRKFQEKDIPDMVRIWNEVVEEGVAFPQTEYLTLETGKAFFEEQSWCGVAQETESRKILGLYILHPNNVGRCGHICNASFAVSSEARGKQIGRRLMDDCLEQAARLGFAILQFNAVVASNILARKLYEKVGFVQLGVIPGGFRMKDGHYEDIVLYYYLLQRKNCNIT